MNNYPKVYKKIIQEIANQVKTTCKSKSNYYGYGAWTHHISSVVKFAKILAKKLNADIQVVEIAALLHDYASVLNKYWYPDHHLHSAKIAGDMLKKYDFPEDKIKAIQHCILCHRSSKEIPGNTVEASIVSSADALAHFDNVDSLLYLAYVNHKMDIDEGKKWVLGKLERSWSKLIPEGKKLIEEKYKAIITILS